MTDIPDNKAIICRYVDELNRGNFDILKEVVADSVALYSLLRTDRQEEPEVVSRQEYEQSIRDKVSAFPDYFVTILDILAEDDRVMICWQRQFTHQAEYLGVPPTGRAMVERSISIYRLSNGRITEVRAFWDWADSWRQLGLIPAYDEIMRQKGQGR